MRGSTVVRALGTAGLALFLLAAFSPLGPLLDRAIAVPERLEAADAIVVLAADGVLANGQLADASLRRAARGIALYRQGLAPLLVLSGAVGRRSESAARAMLARACSVPDGAILAVTAGTTTHEEAATFRSLLQPRGVRRVLLVTDASHMRRARGLFQSAGFEVLAAPVVVIVSGERTHPEQRLRLLRDALRESVGLAYYHVAGYL